jgi:hypothetical protein
VQDSDGSEEIIAVQGEEATMARACLGALHVWPRPAPQTYPWQNSALARVCTLVTPAGRFQSTSCTGIADRSSGDCHACRDLAFSPTFPSARERAGRSMDNPAMKTTPTEYLTWGQLAELRLGHAAQLSALRLALFNSSRGAHRALRRVEVHARLLQCLATADVKNVRRLLLHQLKAGSTPETIITKLAAASAGLYKARGYSDADLDLCIIVWRCGGARALGALARHTGFPSESTVRRAAVAAIVLVAHSKEDFERTIRNNLAGLKASLKGAPPRLLLVCFDGVHTLPWVGTDTSGSSTPILTGFCAAPGHCLSTNQITC